MIANLQVEELEPRCLAAPSFVFPDGREIILGKFEVVVLSPLHSRQNVAPPPRPARRIQFPSPPQQSPPPKAEKPMVPPWVPLLDLIYLLYSISPHLDPPDSLPSPPTPLPI